MRILRGFLRKEHGGGFNRSMKRTGLYRSEVAWLDVGAPDYPTLKSASCGTDGSVANR